MQLNLFGEEEGRIPAKRTKAEIFEDYDAFVAKFSADAPKTTDDYFTPQPVYEAILEWLKEKVDIEGRSVVRPFYPGGDYRNYEYPENCVVVDNPPFSILSKIIRFYNATGIDYFLFAPALTLFSCAPKGDCAVVVNVGIVYANGAVVSTGFHTSLFPGKRIMLAGSLKERIEAVDYKVRPVMLPKYEYPDGVETAARLHTAVGGGIYISLMKSVNIFAPLTRRRLLVKVCSVMAICFARPRRVRLPRRVRQTIESARCIGS